MEEEFKKLDMEQKWEHHYEKLFMRSRTHPFEIAGNATNSCLNRYTDVKPYDRSRVKLSRTKDSDYINANLVTVPKAARQYILTQGPLPETLSHFWLMVWEQKSNVIVMLNKILEMEDFVKCEQYWPSKLNDTDKYDDVKLTVTLKSVKVEKHYTVREMLLTDEESKKSRTILQFHYTAWPDHSEPDSPTSLLRLLTAIRKSGGLDKMDEPTVVHCSAGIGRSGTFCLIDSILSMIENQGSTEGIDIDNTLIEMRDYRMGLIQSPVQLKFAYMSIIYGVKILQAANKLHPHISSVANNIAFDNNTTSQTTSQHQSQQEQNQQNKTNGSSHVPKKPNRRNKKKNSSSNSGSLNVFQKNLLVEALDDIDSDEADSLFYYTMRQLPNVKKPRNSSPDEDLSDDQIKQTQDLINNGIKGSSTINQFGVTKVQKLDNAINSLLAENTISTSNSKTSSSSTSSNAPPQTTDSALLRRREKELRNKEMAERIQTIKDNMKARELSRERWVYIKKSFVGVAVLVVGSLVYMYMGRQS